MTHPPSQMPAHPSGLLSPMVAALAMSLSSASVIANALRLRHAKLAGGGADAGATDAGGKTSAGNANLPSVAKTKA